MAVGIYHFSKCSELSVAAKREASRHLHTVAYPARVPRITAAAALATAVALVATGCGSHQATSTGFDGAIFPAGVRAPNFTLSDLSGHPVSMNGQRGHVVALAFMPGDCRTCLLVAEQLRGALDELGSSADVHTILVSTDPATAPARLKAFLARNALLGRVIYLTADEARLRKVWRAYHATTAHAGRAAAEDSITVLLIDKRGTERVGFGIEQMTPEGLSHDIRLLEAG